MTENKPLISIIILNYNAGKLLIDCVDSILKSNYQNFEIILVDNVSNDSSHLQCKKQFTDIILIENKENLGYCGGNNVGLQASKGEFIIILNPDTIVDPKWIDELLFMYKKNGDGLYQPKFLAISDHKMLLSTGNMIHLFGFGYSRAKGETDRSQYEKFEQISYASGTCIFTSSQILKKIGMFDPFLFAFHDDLELCWRAALYGIKSFYVPKSIVYHPIEGYSFKWSHLKFKLMERNRKYCLLTLYSHKTFIKLLPSLILVDVAVFLFYLSKGLIISKIKADIDIIKNCCHILKRYKKIQKHRTINDHEIIKLFKDEIMVPKWVLSENKNQFFNKFLEQLSKFTRKFI